MNGNSRLLNAVFAIMLVTASTLGAAGPAKAAATTFTVTSLSPDWGFVNDNNTTGDWAAGFESGPSTPPLGSGSAYIKLNSAAAGIILGTQKYPGTLLSAIEALSYSTYTNLSPAAMSFQINYDPDVSSGSNEPWYGRLVYEPYVNGTVTDGIWQSWDLINAGNAKWWASPNINSTVDDTCPQGTPCTLTALLAAFPNIGIRNDGGGAILFKAGSGWDGFDGNVDNLSIQIAGNTDTYNFEPLATIYVDDDWTAVTPGADPDGAGPAQKYEADSFDTIQEGINALARGGTLNVAAGTYTENVNVNKRLRLLGAGSASTIITNPGATDPSIAVVQISGSGVSNINPLLLKDVGIHPVGLAGIGVGRFLQSTGTGVSYLALENVQVLGTNANPCTEQERGLYVDLTSSIQHLSIKNSSFSNLTYGWYLQKAVSADPSTVQFVTVQNTTFNHNNLKGIYAEKLSDAAFTDVIVDGNGFSTAADLALCPYFLPNEAGLDLNLKAGTYQNISFLRTAVTDNALGGAKEGVGLAVKARDDGLTYGAFPATLDNVQITEGTVTGNERGIRVGEPGKNNAGPTNVGIHKNFITGNVQTYVGPDGSTYGGVVNLAQPLVNAENNWWGHASGPSGAGPGTGDAVSTNVDFTPWCINSLCLNDAPVITEGAAVSVSMSENSTPIPFQLILHATDANPADTLTWSISTPASHGTATASGTGTSKDIGYTSNLDFHGVDSFVVRVSDGNGGSDTITVTVIVNRTRYFYSSASQDGWILESSENSSVGGTMNNTANRFVVGDSALNRQYRSILSFPTYNLPDNAVIVSATLRIRQDALVGTSPFTTHGPLIVDMRMAGFSNSPSLQLSDFQALASKSPAFFIGSASTLGWYSKVLPPASVPYIAKFATTQFRLRFRLDDNNDLGGDYLTFYSGNSVLGRPELIVLYHMP